MRFNKYLYFDSNTHAEHIFNQKGNKQANSQTSEQEKCGEKSEWARETEEKSERVRQNKKYETKSISVYDQQKKKGENATIQAAHSKQR